MKKSCGVHALRILVGITMLALLLEGGAGAMTITVNASGGGDYTRIQDAIDNASARDTILVYSGIYHEKVNVTKQLNLRGIDNPVITTGGSGSAITLSANGITLERFTATGSGFDYYDSQEAGIKVTSSNNTLTDNNASNNWNGISLSGGRKNTLTGNKASNNGRGISLFSSSNNTLTGNKASNNHYYGGAGIYLSSSSNNNTLTGNVVSNNYASGIYLFDSRNNMFSKNNASSNNGGGIHLSSSSDNTFTGNNASSNGSPDEGGDYGISLGSSSNNTLTGNNASNNYGVGISLGSSSNNTLTGNNVSNNCYGISLFSSSYNTLSGNMMTGNHVNFNLNGDTDSDFDNHIGISNLVDGKFIYYIINDSDTTYDSSRNAGTLYCISCVNVTIKNLNLKGIYFWNTSKSKIQNVNTSNNDIGIYLKSSRNNTLTGNNASNNWNEYGSGSGYGIYLWNSSNNTLSRNIASNNGYGNGIGIFLDSSSYNTLSGNNASNNHDLGISLSSSNNNKVSGNNASNNWYFIGHGDGITLSSSNDNMIYNNIFNQNNFYFYGSNNVWNITSQSGTNIMGGSLLGGNFWANPEGTGFSQTCKDVNGDGICDKSYTLDEKNIDYLSLAKDNIPPKSVRNLKNITYARNYINWTWKDPKDIDFKKVMVFIDGQFKKNVSKGKRFYNATNFNANTKHTISTRTVDMNGNINKTWANRSAWTAK